MFELYISPGACDAWFYLLKRRQLKSFDNQLVIHNILVTDVVFDDISVAIHAILHLMLLTEGVL